MTEASDFVNKTSPKEVDPLADEMEKEDSVQENDMLKSEVNNEDEELDMMNEESSVFIEDDEDSCELYSKITIEEFFISK